MERSNTINSPNKKMVRCVNACDNGMVKVQQNPIYAGWVHVKCQYCNGSGEMTEEEYVKLDKII